MGYHMVLIRTSMVYSPPSSPLFLFILLCPCFSCCVVFYYLVSLILLSGTYSFDEFTLTVDHVQSDPFAPPSIVIAKIPLRVAGFPPDYHSSPIRYPYSFLSSFPLPLPLPLYNKKKQSDEILLIYSLEQLHCVIS